jgi:MFS family permease
MSDDKQNKPAFFYGWLVLAACVLIGMTAAAQLTYGIYVKELITEFHWSRTLTSSISSVHYFVYSLAAVLAGTITDRCKPRPLIIVSAILLGGGLFLSGFARSVWDLYLSFGVVAALGTSCCYCVPSSVVQRWFIEKRSVALGISMCGISIGSFVISMLVGWLIPRYGWRVGFFAEGAFLFSIMILASFFMVGNPEEKGLLPYGAEKIKTANLNIDQKLNDVWTFKSLIINKCFLGCFANQFFTCISLIIMYTHFVANAEDMGIPKLAAAGALGLVGVISAVGRFQAGYLCERIGYKQGLIISCGLCLVAFLYLTLVKNLLMLYIFVIFYSLGYGGKAMALPGLAGEVFGTNSLGKILGLIAIAFGTGGFIGSVLGGWIFDQTRSYCLAFIAGAFFYLIAILSIAHIKPNSQSSAHAAVK